MLILKALVSYAIVVVIIVDQENLILIPKSSPLDFCGTSEQTTLGSLLVLSNFFLVTNKVIFTGNNF